MSRIITNNLRHNDASSDNLTLDGTGNITAPGNLSVTGTSTLTGNVSASGNLSVTGTSTFTDDLAVDTDTLFVDASADRVGINVTAPDDALHVLSADGNLRVDTSTNGGSASLLFDVPATNGLRATGHRARISCEHTGSGWDSDMVFYGGNTNTTPTERIRILSDGGITFNGDTANANALDDYEEGSWTVQVNNTTVSTNVRSKYTKIGNKVTCQCRFDNVTFPTFSGVLEVSLPFQAVSGISIYPMGPLCYFYPLANWDTFSNFVGFRPATSPGSTRATFSFKQLDGDWQGSLTSSNTNVSGQSGLYMEFQLTYWTP